MGPVFRVGSVFSLQNFGATFELVQRVIHLSPDCILMYEAPQEGHTLFAFFLDVPLLRLYLCGLLFMFNLEDPGENFWLVDCFSLAGWESRRGKGLLTVRFCDIVTNKFIIT